MSRLVINKNSGVLNAINQQVANWTVLFTKLHNYHWFVQGSNFLSLHAKFEEFYNEGAQHLDDLAERLLAIGGRPVATLKDCLQLASVKEADGHETAEQMLSVLIQDFSQMSKELQQGIEAAETAADAASGDMLLGIKESLEKHAWMLKAILGKA
ncbi:Dps family protein [Paenibacillus sp. y28]|uniref:Dps family protein n=1 Tax=Paenibacillus sp. y28 TaxID=3129110 RepID=UPI003016CDF0